MEATEKRFNLIDEPWIRVLLADSGTSEVSLKDALVNAHRYRDLAGELPTQDAAILRLMLAVLHTVFSRVDENGNVSPLTRKNAPKRWETLWKRGELPKEPIEKYLAEWHERFWLFHPERPFYQVPEAAEGTAYGAPKLNGELSESSNKVRLFPKRSGTGKEALAYGEAARWLLHVVNYDDASLKKPSPTMGWLGKLGLIVPTGNDLFETLMLNLTLLKDGEKEWGRCLPIWELEEPRNRERVEIYLPDNPAELLTLQSRRLLLTEKVNRIMGYKVLGGDFFQKEDAFSEQMTIWKPIEKNKTVIGYVPKRHESAKQMWREFSSFVHVNQAQHLPGIVSWVTALREEGYLDQVPMIRFRIASVQYGDSDYMATDVYSDTLSFHVGLLSELGKMWRVAVNDQIARCDRIADCVGRLASEISKAQGGDGTSERGAAKEQFYYRIDEPFRIWLSGLDPESGGEIGAQTKEWEEQSLQVARTLGREMVADAGQAAFTGRIVKQKEKGKDVERFYSAPKSYNLFLNNLKQIDK
jgi:CRISPR system Cascade subunit CasA